MPLQSEPTDPLPMDTSGAEDWQAESVFCGLLARLWIAELDAETLTALQEPAACQAFQQLGGQVPEAADPAVLDQLAIEFCGCFLGPRGHLPPHQSVVAHSRFQGSCLESVQRYLEVLGPPTGIFALQSQPDHAGVLLSLWQRLLGHRGVADPADQPDLEELQDAFRQQHLDWLVDYCQAALRRQPGAFYAGLFTVTLAYLNR